MEVDYLVKEDRPGVFVVSKWELDKEPVAVYRVERRRDGYVCDCPSPKPHCKHMDVVDHWLDSGRPQLRMIKWKD